MREELAGLLVGLTVSSDCAILLMVCFCASVGSFPVAWSLSTIVTKDSHQPLAWVSCWEVRLKESILGSITTGGGRRRDHLLLIKGILCACVRVLGEGGREGVAWCEWKEGSGRG